MKVILQKDIKTLGRKGAVVEVSEGYARNYLIKNKLVVEATAENMNVLKSQQGALMKRKERDFEEAKKLAEVMKKITLKFTVKAGEGGRLFGSVTAKDIAEKLNDEHKIEVDKKKVMLEDAIKTAGVTEVEVKLYEGVNTKIKVQIVTE
ncbi:MAG: 50S ribosomal protein L9 [Clostridia bacterium]|nr:50S ribosomal protein L9 [Clostridia bacterium]